MSAPEQLAPEQLKVGNLHFSYGKKPVLKGVDFQPKAGEVTVLLGANGAGKSTLFRCLAGLLKPSQGKVHLGATDLLQLSSTQRLKRVCYIPQAFFVNARLTVYETVLLAKEQSGQKFSSRQAKLSEVEHVLELTGLTDLAETYLNELSGGQQQRVGTAQALSQNPEVLLMDEPTSALDLRYQLETLELISDFTRQQSITTLIALHDINLAVRYGGWVLLLENGQVTLQGKPMRAVENQTLGDAYNVELEAVHTPSGIPLVAARLREQLQERLEHAEI